MQDQYLEYMVRLPIRTNTPGRATLVRDIRFAVQGINLPRDHPQATVLSCGINYYANYYDATSINRQMVHVRDALDRLERLVAPQCRHKRG
jgi:hypothetical protein